MYCSGVVDFIAKVGIKTKAEIAGDSETRKVSREAAKNAKDDQWRIRIFTTETQRNSGYCSEDRPLCLCVKNFRMLSFAFFAASREQLSGRKPHGSRVSGFL